MPLSSLEALREIAKKLSPAPDEIPDGFKSVATWATECRISRSSAERILISGAKYGLLETAVYRIRSASGKLGPVRHYRIKP